MLLEILEVIETGLHLCNFGLGRIELVIHLVRLLIAARAINSGQLISFVCFQAFLFLVGPEWLVIEISPEVGSMSVHQ